MTGQLGPLPRRGGGAPSPFPFTPARCYRPVGCRSRRTGAVVYPQAPVDVVDVVLIVLVVLAAVHGLRLGAVVQILTFGGFLLGLLVGGALAVLFVSSVHSATTRNAVTLLLVLGLGVLVGVAGRVIGSWGHLALPRVHLGTLDGVLGVGVAAVAVLLSAWLLASVLTQSSYSWVNSQIQRSDVLRADRRRPAPGTPGSSPRCRRFLADPSFPSVFAGVSPTAAPPVAVPSSGTASTVAAGAARSTVKVLGEACGYVQEGSGFVVRPGLVVTNAHVVAGETVHPGRRWGTWPIRPRRCCSTPTSTWRCCGPRAARARRSPSIPTRSGRGTQAAVLGYPEDGATVGDAGRRRGELTRGGPRHLQPEDRDPQRLRARRRRAARQLRWPARRHGRPGDRGGLLPLDRLRRRGVRPDVARRAVTGRSWPSSARRAVGTGACTEG